MSHREDFVTADGVKHCGWCHRDKNRPRRTTMECGWCAETSRTDPDLAYAAFMSMPQSEWLGLIGSLLCGGVLEPAEQIGFQRAVHDRKVRITQRKPEREEP